MEALASAAPPQLPARLLRFFAKYPPQLYGAKFTNQHLPLTSKDAKLLRVAQNEEREQRTALRLVAEEENKQKRAARAARIAVIERQGLSRYPPKPPRLQPEENVNARYAAIEAQRAPDVVPVLNLPSIFSTIYTTPRDIVRRQNAAILKANTALKAQRRVEHQAKLEKTPRAVQSVNTIIPLNAVMSPRYTTIQQLKPQPSRSFPQNPFLPRKSNSRWTSAHFGLRRQAELVKIAKAHGVEALLPASKKSTAFKQQRLLERGLRVRGTGEGQKVKGHKWERNFEAKMEKRYDAMVNMPALVRDWERRGHGKGLKREQYPKVKMP